MATEYERLAVMLEARVADFEKKIAGATRNADRSFKRMETSAQKMSARLSSSYAGIAASAAKAFALIGGAQGFRQLSDSGTRITNSLKVAGLAGEELEGVYQKLFSAAQKNAAPLETLVQLYGRVSLVQGELGVSSEEIINLSDNVALALRASGQSSQEASGALLQLSQALGAGVVRAEEFNSILEGAPTILQAAASGIKQAEGSVAKLRQIMLEGKLSSKAFFDGINAGAPVLEQKVAGAVLTVDQRLENLRTALTNSVRKFNDSTQAANTFGGAIDNMSTFVNSVDMDGLAEDIGKIITALQSGAAAAENLGLAIGRLSGLEKIGQGIVESFGENGKISFFGGALGIESTLKGEGKLSRIAEQRLAIETQIEAIRKNRSDDRGAAAIRNLEAQLASLKETASTIPPTIGGELDYNRFSPPTKKTLGGKKFTPIDITDPQYRASGDSDGKASKARADQYAREVEQITKRTAALQAETTAQSGINPLLNDYGFAIEFARAKQELLTAAQEAGVKVTPELTASVEQLAEGYANAVVESDRLAETQDKIRERAEEAMATAKDVTRGVIDGFFQGAEAADILADSLKKIADTLLDDVLDSIFKVRNAGSGGGGFISSILGGLFGSGKFPAAPGGSGVPMYASGTPSAKRGVALVGEKGPELVRFGGGEQVIPNSKIGALGGSMPSIQAPTIPKLSAPQTHMNTTIAPVITIDASGADRASVARLEMVVARISKELPGNILKTLKQVGPRGIKI